MDKRRIDLIGAIEIIQKHLTEGLCQSSFKSIRTTERDRVWTLHLMMQFWIAVILRAPKSLRIALDEALHGSGGFPLVQASPQAFFARAQKLRWKFFASVLERFTEAVVADCPAVFERDLQKDLSSFSQVLVVDGSRLDPIAHRLKVLHKEAAVVLPGCLLGIYDLFRGIPRRLLFCEDAMRAEVPHLKEALDDVPKDALLVADRAYCSHVLFGELSKRGIFALVRCTRSIRLDPIEVLSRRQHEGGTLTDTLVRAGTPQRPKQQQTLRLIEWKKDKTVIRLLTNVLDPALLPATVALALYRRRWSIERMFYDLKEVLNLNCFHAANVNAIGMQVHAAAVVYVALRAAQARIAQQVDLPPEDLSVEKLFPRLAAAHYGLVTAQLSFVATEDANPKLRLVEPDWRRQNFASVPLSSILVDKGRDRRRRSKWKRPRGQPASLHRYTGRKELPS